MVRGMKCIRAKCGSFERFTLTCHNDYVMRPSGRNSVGRLPSPGLDCGNANRTTGHSRAVFPHFPNGSKVGMPVEPFSRGEIT